MSCSLSGFIGVSSLRTQSEAGGWKWMPLGLASQWLDACALEARALGG